MDFRVIMFWCSCISSLGKVAKGQKYHFVFKISIVFFDLLYAGLSIPTCPTFSLTLQREKERELDDNSMYWSLFH